MTPEQFGNFGQSTLTSGISAGAVSIPVVNAALYPVPSASSPMRVTIDQEVFLMTAVSGNTFTGAGGQEGTTQATHLNGSLVQHGLTAAHMQAMPLGGRAVTTQSAGNIALNANDNVVEIALASGAVAGTITMPASPIPYKIYTICDTGTNFASANQTLTPNSGQGAFIGNAVLSVTGMSVDVFYNGTNWRFK